MLDKGNNSRTNLAALAQGPWHFVGSLVPTQYPELLPIPRRRLRRLDPRQLPGVRACRTRHQVFGVWRTLPVTFNQNLYQTQSRTLQREIAKRRRAFFILGETLLSFFTFG